MTVFMISRMGILLDYTIPAISLTFGALNERFRINDMKNVPADNNNV